MTRTAQNLAQSRYTAYVQNEVDKLTCMMRSLEELDPSVGGDLVLGVWQACYQQIQKLQIVMQADLAAQDADAWTPQNLQVLSKAAVCITDTFSRRGPDEPRPLSDSECKEITELLAEDEADIDMDRSVPAAGCS